MPNRLLHHHGPQPRSRTGAALSITLHTLGAVAAFAASDDRVHRFDPPDVQETKFVLQARSDEPVVEAARGGAASAAPPVDAPPPVVVPPITVPIGLAEFTLDSRPITDADWSRPSGHDNATAVDGGVSGAPLAAAQVERPVVLIPGSPSPRYPATLRAAGIEGDALVQFVVDTTGRVELKTFAVLRSTHDLFTMAVRAALAEMRFIPAEAGGRRVRQLVQQPFMFALAPR